MQEFSRIVDLFENPATEAAGAEHPLKREGSGSRRPNISNVIALSRSKTAREPIVSISWQSVLGRIVEAEIIPRLYLSAAVQQRTCAPQTAFRFDMADFIKLLFDADASMASIYVRRLQAQGTPLDSIFIDVLGGAARTLGALWESDHCDFMDVTNALHRLHCILQNLTMAADAKPSSSHRVMFLTAPCETHDFGLAVVEKFFRAAGWQTKRCGETDYIAALREQHYDVVGFSVSCDRYIDGLQAAVKKARQVSKNVSLRVMVGGDALLRNSDLVGVLGADAMAADAPSAVLIAEALLKEGAFV